MAHTTPASTMCAPRGRPRRGRVRLRQVLLGMDQIRPRKDLVKDSSAMEIEGGDEPALIAETLLTLYEKKTARAV